MAESDLAVTGDILADYVNRFIGEDDTVVLGSSSDYVQRVVDKAYAWFLMPSLAGAEFHRWSFLKKTTTIKAYALCAWTVSSGFTASVSDTGGSVYTTVTLSEPILNAGHVGKAITITDGQGASTVSSVTSSTVCVIADDQLGVLTDKTFTLAATTAVTNPSLPDDFESFLSDLVSGDGTTRVPIIAEPDFLAINAQAPDSTGAKYATYRVSDAPTGGVSQRYELILYPGLPTDDDTSWTFTYSYVVYPATALAAGTVAYGGPQHSQTLIELTLAVAELDINDVKGEHWERAMEMLKASIEFDKIHYQRVSKRPYPIAGASSTHDSLYLDLKREMGAKAGFGFDTNAWSHDENERINYLMGRGERQVYFPPPDGQGRVHQWRFLRVLKTLMLWQSISAKEDKSTITATVTPPSVTVTASAAVFDSSMVGYYLCPHDDAVSVPTKIATYISPTQVTLTTAAVTMDADTFTVSPYFATLSTLTFSPGGGDTPFTGSMVGKSIVGYDKAGVAFTRTITSYNSSDGSITLDTTIDDFLGGLGFAITADGYYRMPSDVTEVNGPITHTKESGDVHFSVNINAPNWVRRMHHTYPDQTGQPLYSAFMHVEGDGTAQYSSDSATSSQALDYFIFPLPDENYEVEIDCTIIPPRLTATNKYPAGGNVFHDLFLASCLAMVEMEFGGEGQARGYFLDRLATAIAIDRRAVIGENLGRNIDRSDDKSATRPKNFHLHNNQIVSYTT